MPHPPLPPRAWQRMLSGRRLDLLAPDPSDIALEDIAHGLARVARWNGQTTGPHAFTVAQHSLMVADIVVADDGPIATDLELAALLHDGAEYVIGDLISPFKAAIGADYRAVEERLQAAIHAHFGLLWPLAEPARAAIKRADRIAAYFEATHLAGFSVAEAGTFFGTPHDDHAWLADHCAPKPSDWVQAKFLARARSLLPGAERARQGPLT